MHVYLQYLNTYTSTHTATRPFTVDGPHKHKVKCTKPSPYAARVSGAHARLRPSTMPHLHSRLEESATYNHGINQFSCNYSFRLHHRRACTHVPEWASHNYTWRRTAKPSPPPPPTCAKTPIRDDDGEAAAAAAAVRILHSAAAAV